jgi:hypothetical protein
MMAPEYEKACALLEPHAIFKGVKEVSRLSGARSASDLAKWIKEFS